IFCLEDFKVEFQKLSSKKSYRDIEKEIIDYFFDKSIGELESGVRLNNSDDTPYIKKRLKGRGGYRCYFLLILKKDSLYLMFVHPKTGTSGSSNITDESKTYLYKKIYKSIENQDLYELSLDESKKKIIFSKSVQVPA
ncbi:MAG: hypothetical protein ABJO28_15705, partial [Maribacter dokdonensis]|uniref:hypothetical protein n=1 Tax=Maribacter dokdonensis TaxID=320912 RepID=UPI0032989773